MSRRSTRAAVRSFPNANARVEAPHEIDITVFPSRPLARTFHRVSTRDGLIAVRFSWATENGGGWRSTERGGLFIQTPPGAVPEGWYATKREALEVEIAQAMKAIDAARAHLAAAEEYVEQLRGQLR